MSGFTISNSSSLAYADETIILSKGQTIYVPAYSHIYSGDREKAFLIDCNCQH